jgi:hypothetical protein
MMLKISLSLCLLASVSAFAQTVPGQLPPLPMAPAPTEVVEPAQTPAAPVMTHSPALVPASKPAKAQNPFSAVAAPDKALSENYTLPPECGGGVVPTDLQQRGDMMRVCADDLARQKKIADELGGVRKALGGDANLTILDSVGDLPPRPDRPLTASTPADRSKKTTEYSAVPRLVGGGCSNSVKVVTIMLGDRQYTRRIGEGFGDQYVIKNITCQSAGRITVDYEDGASKKVLTL